LLPLVLLCVWPKGLTFYGLSGGLGFAFAYLPEKIARWVLSDLWNLWLTPVWRWLRRSRPQPETQSA
jgi:hypothetical protein